jgi:hypothetical protein
MTVPSMNDDASSVFSSDDSACARGREREHGLMMPDGW